MRLTKRQLKRIIKEEYSRLKRRGLIQESRPIAGGAAPSAEFSAICEGSFGIPCGPNSPMHRLFEKIYDCFVRMTDPMECAEMMSGPEMGMFMDDFMNILVECQHAECREMLHYCMELESCCY